MRRLLRLLKWGALCMPLLFLFAIISIGTSRWERFPHGTPADWFNFACGIDIGEMNIDYGSIRGNVGFYPGIGDDYLFYVTYQHEQRTYRVSEADLLATVPQAREKLEEPSDLTESMRRYYGYIAGQYKAKILKYHDDLREPCFALAVNEPDDRKLLLGIEEMLTKDVSPERIERLNKRWYWAQRVWVTCAFEFMFLSAWWFFTVFFILSRRNLGWAAHIGFSPLLLMVPHFFGYAPYLFTHGPAGGYLYPRIVQILIKPFSSLGYTSLDQLIFPTLPSPLFYLSQVDGPPPIASFWGAASPTLLLAFGIYGIIVTWMFRKISGLSSGWKRRHEVETVQLPTGLSMTSALLEIDYMRKNPCICGGIWTTIERKMTIHSCKIHCACSVCGRGKVFRFVFHRSIKEGGTPWV